ncbi:HD domain-containing protein [Vagococcus lutrae]|uniref:HD domain-containing protein n=1 Tax=Vagococcus lutrae TaxID=81947 RepID=UPI00200FF74A|nr:HD domain-containing protein [Vagococcus lutrae]MDT2824170.1 HD domain-containing protein [Vagococcus lutrae]UQF18313.1 HD domain-containing protein [Vagococcus lutrae]
MLPRELLDILSTAEKLKDTTRHCYTSKGRHESVAEHTWMMTFIAFLISEEFTDIDMDRVIKMCIIHDLGECFTGDIPTFDKTNFDEQAEKTLLKEWINNFPLKNSKIMLELYREMEKMETREAKVYKAIDSLEALIQHNLSDLSTWSEKEKTFNLTYAEDRVEFSDYFKELRREIKKDTIIKLEEQRK